MDRFTIGILALQGDVHEHANAVNKLGAETIPVKYEKELDLIDGLIIPGGESTTINKLTSSHARSLFSKIKQLAKDGLPIYGTCMGSIMLAKSVLDSDQETLSLMDITVKRNAYGSQKSSFETQLSISGIGAEQFQAIFIRAPQIESVKPNVEVLATVDNTIVACKQNNFLATTFHPELVADTRVHNLFLKMVVNSKDSQIKQFIGSDSNSRIKLQA